jgi:VanZ family protein
MAASRLRYWLPVVFFMGFIFYMSGRRGEDLPSLFAYQDIVFHLLIYALLGWSFGRALACEKEALSFFKIVCLCAVFGLLYGISDEYHQSFIPGRTSDIFDVMIDVAGSFMGGLIVKWLR